MNPSILFIASTVLFAWNWNSFVGAVPYGIKFGIISMVGCLAAILMKEMILGKPTGTLRNSINRYMLSFILGSFLTWFGQNILGLNENYCYVIAAVVGLTIEVSAPWIQNVAFVWLKKVFKS